MKNVEILYKNRYMLSVNDTKEIRWIRDPFMSKRQLDMFLFEYAKNPSRYENLEIFMEPTLDTLVGHINEENKLDKSYTLREHLFGSFYQENVSVYQADSEFRKFFAYR
jgi:hypothetical protein